MLSKQISNKCVMEMDTFAIFFSVTVYSCGKENKNVKLYKSLIGNPWKESLEE